MTGLTNRQKKNKAKKIMEYLDKVFPDVECELDFSNNLELVIAVLLSAQCKDCLLYTSPSPRDRKKSRMPSSA